MLLLHVDAGVRRAEMIGHTMPSDETTLLLYLAVDAMLPDVYVTPPRLAARKRHLRRLIEAMPQHAARILDRVPMVPDTRAIRYSDERTLERLVASYGLMACHRDVLYAVFEASFAKAYRAFEFDADDSEESDDSEEEDDSEDGEFTVVLGEHGVRLEGIVRTSRSSVKVEGTLFTTAYVASETYQTAVAFMSMFSRNMLQIGKFARFQTRADARRLFEAARAARRR